MIHQFSSFCPTCTVHLGKCKSKEGRRSRSHTHTHVSQRHNIICFTHVAVFLLDKSKESRHIRSPKMVASLQSGEQTTLWKSLKYLACKKTHIVWWERQNYLEMVLADVEHGCPKIKLVEELPERTFNKNWLRTRPIFLTQRFENRVLLKIMLSSLRGKHKYMYLQTSISIWFVVYAFKHLGDEYVHIQHVRYILPLNFPGKVSKHWLRLSQSLTSKAF